MTLSDTSFLNAKQLTELRDLTERMSAEKELYILSLDYEYNHMSALYGYEDFNTQFYFEFGDIVDNFDIGDRE